MHDKILFNYDMIIDVFEDTPLGIFLMEDTKFIDLNKYALHLLEYEDKFELIGGKPSLFSPSYQPNGRHSEEYLEEVYKKAIENGYNKFDWVHKTKKGEMKWFEVTLKRLARTKRLLVAYLKEITKEKKMEEQFNSFMKNLPASAYIKNSKLEYIFLNEYAKKLGKLDISDDEVKSRRLTSSELISKDFAKIIEVYDKKVLETGKPIDSLITYPNQEGVEHSYRNIKFLIDNLDTENYVGGMFLDITDLTRANKRIKTLVESLISTIQLITEERDPYTTGHEMRVSSLAVEIGKKLNFTADRIEGLRIGALIHDIGKIHVPLEILNKPGKLTEIQFRLVQEHSVVGSDLVQSIQFDWPIKQMVRHHHEKYDGSGYPDGLVGEDILLEARIICVADVIEAMSSHRPYRPAKPMSEAITELLNGKGTLYDPQIVDACLEVINLGTNKLKGWDDFKR